MSLELFQVSGWNPNWAGKNINELAYKDKYISMDGTTIDTDLHIKFPFRLIKIELKHVDGSDDDNTSSLDYDIQRSKHGLFYTLAKDDAVAAVTMLLEFGEKYEYPPTTIRISLKTTNTHRIYPTVSIQRMQR